MRIAILILLLFIFNYEAGAQRSCSGPGRTAGTAEAVCGSLVFHQTNLSNCTGPNIPNPTAGCGNIVTSNNSAWYKFHCYQSGTLGFLLTPLGGGDDYDWEVMDVTGHNPNDVFLTELRVSLNLSGVTGPTGCTATGSLDVHCAGGPFGSQFNQMPLITAGHDYLLMVNNWSQSGLGYDISFSGTAVLTSGVAPTITSAAIPGCDATKLKVVFSEDILCSSISADASEFIVTGGPNTITGITSNCSLGAKGIPSLVINFQAPLAPGNYQLNIVNGNDDNNTLANVCQTLMLPVSIPFTVAAVPPATVNTITYTGCAPTALDVQLTKPVFCSSVTASGSEFTIQPGNIAVTSVQTVCTGGNPVTDMLHLNLPTRLPQGNYQLLISNGTDGDTFIDTCNNRGAATAFPFVITQTTVAPVIQSIVFDECHPNKVTVNFDKPVFCGSISPTGNEFAIIPAAGPVISVNYVCNNIYNYTTQAVITLQNPLPAGNFAVAINAGSDGNTLADTCFAFIANGYNKTFTTTKAPAPKFDSVQVDKCTPTFVKLFYSKPIQCTSVSANGSDYTITGPAVANIASATTDPNCAATGYTNWVMLQLAQPLSVPGNYIVHNKMGTDGDGIIDTCISAQNTAEIIAFTPVIKPSAAFSNQVKFGCTMDTVTLSHPGGNGANLWLWTFADGSTATGQTVTKTFPVSTITTAVQLKVDNSFCNDMVTQNITLDNAFKAAFAFDPNDTACIKSPVAFINNSIGKNLQYLWQLGDNTQFAGQTPPPHVYITSNAYNVKLIVTDPYGCTDIASSILQITAMPTIDFTGLAAQYCTDKTISLAKVISNNIFTYTWDNGDGSTFTNQPRVQFSYPKQGAYTITLTGTDKYCGAAQVSKPINVFTVPKFTLGNDTVLCPAISLPIGVLPTAGYTYLWNTGAITPQIMTDIFTAKYSLFIDNNGCNATDDISVKVLPACLIKVPNAFTPNSDGVNDILRAANADLAKAFTFKIYNRLGELMFSTTNPLDGWNGYYKGVRAEAATYIWQLTYIDPWSNKNIFESGTSILIR